jgi:hypothetical protein
MSGEHDAPDQVDGSDLVESAGRAPRVTAEVHEEESAGPGASEPVRTAEDALGPGDPSLAQSSGIDTQVGLGDTVEAPSDPPAGPVASEEASAEQGPGVIAPVTAADVPALEGCDVERAWEEDETCADADPDAAADIEPAAVPADVASRSERPSVRAEKSARTVPWWPFVAYFAVWALLAALAGYYLAQVPEQVALYETELYGYTVLGGLVLTAAGPLVILATWLATWWKRRGGSRTGLLSSALLKGALATFGGVAVWWGMLVIVDTLRLGRSM